MIRFVLIFGIFLFSSGCGLVTEVEETTSSLSNDLQISLSLYDLEKDRSSFDVGGKCRVGDTDSHKISWKVFDGNLTGNATAVESSDPSTEASCIRGTFSIDINPGSYGSVSNLKLRVEVTLEGKKKKDVATAVDSQIFSRVDQPAL